jgi:prevent-host-death family protein
LLVGGFGAWQGAGLPVSTEDTKWSTCASIIQINKFQMTGLDIIIMLMMMKNTGARSQTRESEISTNELRLNFDRVLKAVKQGRSLTLTYRNKPLARIVPLKERLLSGDDPIYRMYELAEPIGAPLTNEEMDKLIYGR